MRSRKPGAKRSTWRLDGRAHVPGRGVGDVAVRVARVLAGRCPRRVDLALLAEDQEGALAVASAVHVALRGADLLEGAPHVHRGGLAARRVLPGDRPVEGPVELEDAGTVAVAREPAAVAGGKRVAGDADELLGGGVEEDDPARRGARPGVRCGGPSRSRRPGFAGRRPGRAAIAWEPPAATGQSSTWAVIANSTAERRGEGLGERQHRVRRRSRRGARAPARRGSTGARAGWPRRRRAGRSAASGAGARARAAAPSRRRAGRGGRRGRGRPAATRPRASRPSPAAVRSSER